jgi:A/G-specific adenine glycosylase
VTDRHIPTADRFRSDLLSWAANNTREFPWRDPERTPYEVFVAEFFLTQTPAENVADVYPRFLKRFPSLASVAEVDTDALEETIRPLGFQRMRAEALAEIAADYESLPETPAELQTLPRVGPYVANATLCFALERPLPIVDRNVNRVYGRVFGERYPGSDGGRREFADRLLPDDGSDARRYNLGLLDFGAQVCTAQDPACTNCFASRYCKYYELAEK